MADASHLERMGRELKCPICLSLLNSAVSLTCNHVFCDSCIQKSMKAASECPVCRVPYRRREVRPATHMDNMVSIYKSMEVASGVNIFVTQHAASTKLSDKDNQTGVNLSDAQDNGHTELEAFDSANQNQTQRKGKRLKSASITTKRPSASNSMKPSFPAKKRVQVPPYTTLDTQIDPQKLEGRTGEIDRNQPKNCHVLQKDVPYTCAKGESMFSPFFWLREEDDLEKSSQQTDDNQIMYTPPDAPCFSDIKDSDDDVPHSKSPERGTCVESDGADFVDSEMFDWTQRPCSPELCSSPLAVEVEDSVEQNGAASEKTKCPKTILNRRSQGKKRTVSKIYEDKVGMGMSSKKVLNATSPRKSKRVKKAMYDLTAVDIEPDMLNCQDMQGVNKDDQLLSKGKSRKSKKVLSESGNQEKNNLSDGTEPIANGQKPAFANASASENPKNNSEGISKLKKSCKSSKSTKKAHALPQKSGTKQQSGKSVTGKGYMDAEEDNGTLNYESHTKLLPLENDKEVSDSGTKRTYKASSKIMPKSVKKVKFSVEGMSKGNCSGQPLSANNDYTAKGQTCHDIQGATDQFGVKVSAKRDKSVSSLNGGVLLKCNTTSPSNISCAFCQSSEESEASGIMVEYLNGKLVKDNQNARTNGIYVHKNCTEWAPNVYFEEDNVINLETELSRSRKIKCSCCGVNGAALGCYEKSCRRSFHVPCAKLMPQCRWDNENFVMLCPIHAGSQLPNEMPQSKSGQKRKSADERKSSTHQTKATDERKSGSSLKWKSEKKFKNLVLCCSALTNTEKEIVTEFENSSGVMILKSWNSTVTHVIASTDEHGASRRTLKFLMGILEGKWILSVHWIKACMEAGELVDEQPYEISVDIHGIRDGPNLGRLRLLNKQPKLFDGYEFFFTGDFAPSYKGYIHDLVVAAGGKVLNRKPVSGCSATTVIVYSLEITDQSKPSSNGTSDLNKRRAHAEALATSAGAAVATNTWILNSIAGHKLQNFRE
ncbi:hypothetical protein ACP275_13G187300 [Erythranthe tilingii]